MKRVRISKICLVCNSFFKVKKYRKDTAKFCSVRCKAKDQKGSTPWNKGKKTGLVPSTVFKKGHRSWNEGKSWSDKVKNKISESKKGQIPWNKGKKHISITNSKHFGWKDDEAGYVAIHAWIRRHFGTPKICEHCGKSDIDGQKIHWSNKDHKYKRVRKDWQRLCASCHKIYDLKYGLSKH